MTKTRFKKYFIEIRKNIKTKCLSVLRNET